MGNHIMVTHTHTAHKYFHAWARDLTPWPNMESSGKTEFFSTLFEPVRAESWLHNDALGPWTFPSSLHHQSEPSSPPLLVQSTHSPGNIQAHPTFSLPTLLLSKTCPSFQAQPKLLSFPKSSLSSHIQIPGISLFEPWSFLPRVPNIWTMDLLVLLYNSFLMVDYLSNYTKSPQELESCLVCLFAFSLVNTKCIWFPLICQLIFIMHLWDVRHEPYYSTRNLVHKIRVLEGRCP